MTKPPLIILAGPTAVGKTDLSLRLAQEWNAEIISADSMQVYKGMDIGTAKASREEQARVPHHLIDVASPKSAFGVADYVPLAEAAARDILSRGRLPFLVGGTGFYIQAFLKGLDFSEEGTDPSVRDHLMQEAREKGGPALYARLQSLDPEAAQAIHPNNLKRVVRALEYLELSGEKFSVLNERQKNSESAYLSLYLVLTRPREELYQRIDQRVDWMMQQGLPEEVRNLLSAGIPDDSTAFQALGYKELREYERGEISLSEAVERIRLGSRHYAKRQLTWFKREKEAVWIDLSAFDGPDAACRHLSSLIQEHLGQSEYRQNI